MRTFYRRVELVANVSIVIVVILLIVMGVKSFFPNRSETAQSERSDLIKPGMKFTLPGFDWSKKDAHLVLVLRKGCHFCSESAPFYQRLVQAVAKRTDLELIAALPQDAAAAQQYLNELQVSIAEVRQADMTATKVYATPTILLVDKTGTVTELWRGKLQPEKELEVFNRLHLKV
jgi:thioredoxin-related protein